MNLRPLHLLLALALLWRGLMPVGVMAMPGENGFEVRLCGLTGGAIVLDLGIADDGTEQASGEHGHSPCPVGAGVGSMALPSTVAPTLPQLNVFTSPASFLSTIAPRGPPLRVAARGPPQFI